MDVSVVIPTWNGKHLLEAYLPSVLGATTHYERKRGGSCEIVVVDDGGADETESWLAGEYGARISLVRHETNLGFSAACNTGFRRARNPIVLLLNNDVRLKEDCLPSLMEHFASAEVFAVTGKIFDQSERVFCNGGKIARFRRGMWSTWENYDLLPGIRPDLTLLSFTAIGAFSAFDRSKFLQIGGFDPLAIFIEDVEISYRAWKRGWTVRYEPRSIAYHDASRTMDSRYGRSSLDRLSRRSRLLMHWMLLHDPVMFRRHALFLGARILVSWMALDWGFYWGVLTGLRHLGSILAKRRETGGTATRSDREILRMLEEFYRCAPIAPRRD
jgi:GT2 family glycosyltransferase